MELTISKSNVGVSFKPALPLNSTRISRITQIFTDFLSVFIRVISVIRVLSFFTSCHFFSNLNFQFAICNYQKRGLEISSTSYILHSPFSILPLTPYILHFALFQPSIFSHIAENNSLRYPYPVINCSELTGGLYEYQL